MSQITIDDKFSEQIDSIKAKIRRDGISEVDMGLLLHVLNARSRNTPIPCAYFGSLDNRPKRCLALEYEEVRTTNPCPFYTDKCNYEGNN